jgi:hypothetical protein
MAAYHGVCGQLRVEALSQDLGVLARVEEEDEPFLTVQTALGSAVSVAEVVQAAQAVQLWQGQNLELCQVVFSKSPGLMDLHVQQNGVHDAHEHSCIASISHM